MSNGYILLWRKSLDSSVWADAKLWRLWSWCLLRASWKQRTVLLGRSPILLQPGDLAATLAEMSAGTGLSQKEVRSCLALAKKTGCLEVRGTAQGTRIRIVNWQDYQKPGAEHDPCPALSTGKTTGKTLGQPQGKTLGQPQGRTLGQPQGRTLGQTQGKTLGAPASKPPAGSGQALGTPFPNGGKKGSTTSRTHTPETPAAAGADQDVLRRGDCERFLAAYPRRTALAAARAAWARLAAGSEPGPPGDVPEGLPDSCPGGLPPLDELLAAVASQARTPAWTREAGRYIPSAANWLIDQRWSDARPADTGVDQWLKQARPDAAKDREP